MRKNSIKQFTAMKHPATLRQSTSFARAGFTLLELLIVLAIILVIAAMVMPGLITQQGDAMIDATDAKITAVGAHPVGTWAAKHDGTFFKGNDTAAWAAMMNPPPYKGRKLKPLIEEPPTDAWGQVLKYEWNGDGHSKGANGANALKPAIWSIGANGQDEGGGGDDVNNWTPKVNADGK